MCTSRGVNEEKEVLKGIDLDIPAGTVTALVEPSGSGKSTISKLIAGFWDVDGGEITIGGRNIKELSQSDIANAIAYVAQEVIFREERDRELR